MALRRPGARIVPRGVATFHAVLPMLVEQVTEAVATDARRGCPVDEGDLLASIGTEYPRPLVGRVVVGTDHWHPTEYGSPPHWIISHGFAVRPSNPWPLRNRKTGQVFGPVVWHPGTPAQPFLRPALYRKRRLRPVVLRSFRPEAPL